MIGVRLHPADLELLDGWIAANGGNLSRPEAMRRILKPAATRVAEMTVRILRTDPRGDVEEEPVLTPKGYELVDRRIEERRHHAENSTFVRSIEEAAYLVEQGYAIRMGGPGKRTSLISPQSLRIERS